MVSIGASIPVPWNQRNRQTREIAAKHDQLEQLRAEREEQRRAYTEEVERLISGWRHNSARLKNIDSTILPLATKRMQSMEATFRSGRTPLVAVFEAQRAVTDVLIERLKIEQQLIRTWAQLEFFWTSEPHRSHSLDAKNGIDQEVAP